MASTRIQCGGFMGMVLLVGCLADDPHAASSGETTAASEESTTLAESSSSGPAPRGTEDGTSGSTGFAESSSGVEEPKTPPRFDVPVPDAPLPRKGGCRGIDFLFVIDDSSSMLGMQARLVASFTGFMNGIEHALGPDGDVHVGVITSDAYVHNQPGCNALGDLVTQTEDEVCAPFGPGERFATNMFGLETVFPCMARVGASGSAVELPITAAIAALHPSKAGPGGCNEGFLRDDALLVLVIVTDDAPISTEEIDDAHPLANTAGWLDAVVQAKHGDPSAVVAIGFVPWNDVSCVAPGVESPNLIGFIEGFGERGVLASVCLPDYGTVFAETIETIDTACTSFIPPG